MKRIVLFILFAVSTACTKNSADVGGLPDITMDLPKLNTKAGKFNSCAEVLQFRANKVAEWNYYSPPPIDYGPGDALPQSAAAGAPVQSTNTLEHGLDEPDMVKADARSIFIAREGSVAIVNQDSLSLEQTLDLPQMPEIKLYFDSGKLIVMGHYMSNPPTQPCCNQAPVYDTRPPQFAVLTFERGTDGLFARSSFQNFAGNLLGARLKNGVVTLVLTEYLGWEQPFLGDDDGGIRNVPCTNFMRPLVDDYSNNLTYVHNIPVATPAAVQSLGRFGRVDKMYMGQNNLYLLANGYDWFFRDPRYSYGEQQQQAFVSKYSVGGAPAFEAAGMIQGFFDESWLNENADENLYAVTYNSGENRLWTLEQSGSDLNLTAAPLEFSPGEDIRAVRFLGDKAYAVTFQRTDPLFVFDLSVPRTPALAGALTVSGFSGYLHPLANGKLLGVGYDQTFFKGRITQGGVKVSLLDVSQPTAPAEIASQVYGDRLSYVSVAGDHHAFFLDEASGILALPVRLFKTPVDSYDGTLDFSGAMILNPAAPSLTYQKISHWDWIPEVCRTNQNSGSTWWNYDSPDMDVSRFMKIGNALISISPFGVRASDVTNGYATLRELQLPGGAEQCPMPGGATPLFD